MLLTLQRDKSMMEDLRAVRPPRQNSGPLLCQRRGKGSCHMVDEWPQDLPVVMMSLIPWWQRVEEELAFGGREDVGELMRRVTFS